MAEPLDASVDVESVIRQLGLEPHPEGGHFRETWRDPNANGQRGSGTAIYYLLSAGEISRWHRVDAVEIWHHYAGDPLELRIAERAGDKITTHILGRDLANGERPQMIVPKDAWQTARIPALCVRAGWSLAGCTVSPAFEFSGFELAPPDWEP
jgi:predicted cupin superfamily sugar epimerase